MVNVTFGELLQEQIKSDSIIPFENTSNLTKRDIPNSITNFSFNTGIVKGMVISINAGDDTTFDVSVGNAIKVDRTDPIIPVVTELAFTGVTAQLDTNLGDTFSHVFVDILTGVVTTEVDPPDTLSDLNDRIYAGTLIHAGGVITLALKNPIIAYGAGITELAALVFGGGVTISDGMVTANGANLQLDIDAGIFEQYGRGRQFDTNNPNTSEVAAQTPVPVGNFTKVFIEAGGDLNRNVSTNTLDPTLFNEDGLGTLETVANNQFTVIRVFYAVLPVGTSRLISYYGTEAFSNINDALAAVEPTFVEHIDTVQLSPVAKIAIQEGVTDLAAAITAGTAIIQLILRRV